MYYVYANVTGRLVHKTKNKQELHQFDPKWFTVEVTHV